MLLSLFKTSGHSMEPVLSEGSFFIGSSIPFMFSKPKTGDIVLFKNNNKLIVKRIIGIEKGKYITSGDNKNDSLHFDPIKREDIMGKVILKF